MAKWALQDGKWKIGASGKWLVSPDGCCCGCDEQPAFDGCYACACSRAHEFKVCVEGFSGAYDPGDTVLNSPGHVLTRDSDTAFSKTVAGSYKIELNFTSFAAPVSTWDILLSLWDGSSFVPYSSYSGSMNSGDCFAGPVNPEPLVYFTIFAILPAVPDEIEATTDYNGGAKYCTDNRAYGHPTKTWIIDGESGLEATVMLERTANVDRCEYAAYQGTIDIVNAVDATERMDGVPVRWTFDLISKTFLMKPDFTGFPTTLDVNLFYNSIMAGTVPCVTAGGSMGPEQSDIACLLPGFPPVFVPTTGGPRFSGNPGDPTVEIVIPAA